MLLVFALIGATTVAFLACLGLIIVVESVNAWSFRRSIGHRLNSLRSF